MSLYIPGLNLPQANQELWIAIQSDGSLRYNSCGWHDSQQKAIAVQSHGRLGDLDALAQQIEHERFNHTHTDGLAARHHVAEYGHFLKAISDAPTIIPAEEGE